MVLPLRSSDSESQPMRRCGRAASSAEVSSALSMSSVEPSTAAASAAACASASSSTPGAGSISAMIWPPGTSMLPQMAISASTQWAAWLPFWFWSNARPQAMDAGFAAAYRRAAR